MAHTTTYYKLCHSTDDTKEFYIGSSDDIKTRISCHKSSNNSRGHQQRKPYGYIRRNGGFENWKFEILEEVVGEQKYDKLLKEAFYIRTLKPTLNSNTGDGMNLYDVEATYLCGRCGMTLKGKQQSKSGVKAHHKTEM